MESIVTSLKQPWNLMRILRMAFGLYISVTGFMEGQYLFLAFGLFFIYQAVLNVGCMACSVSPTNKIKEDSEEILFEEIKKKKL